MDLALVNGDYWTELSRFLDNKDGNWADIKRALVLATKAHRGQKRVSGEDYISHPVWVAKVAAQLDLGKEMVIAGLLHDTIEDTKLTIDEIAKEFGDEVALLVAGLTEVKKKTHAIEVHQTSIEVFREFLFSSVDDVRILILRLIDKLHNGLTIEYLPENRQIKYANRIMGIYSPVAEYVGLHYFKKLLDDIAFRIKMPEEAKKLEKLLEENKKNELMALSRVQSKINDILKINRIEGVEINGRIKSLYSTFLKIKRKGDWNEVKDRVGVRILTKSVADCYMILGLLHAKYPYLPDEFDDYISNPKPNGYRSIQTTLIWKEGLTVEVQIRTFEMHEFNEFGPASHIAYKAGKDMGKSYSWVKELVAWQKNDKLKNYRIKVLTDYIYVFTPKGDTLQLPAGATALDFAYQIHGDVGDKCCGALINKKMTKIETKLKTGDMVEILTGKTINANEDWLPLVITAEAKSRIRRAIISKRKAGYN